MRGRGRSRPVICWARWTAGRCSQDPRGAIPRKTAEQSGKGERHINVMNMENGLTTSPPTPMDSSTGTHTKIQLEYQQMHEAYFLKYFPHYIIFVSPHINPCPSSSISPPLKVYSSPLCPYPQSSGLTYFRLSACCWH